MDELATLIENILSADGEEALAAALNGVDLDQAEQEMTTTAQQMLASGDDSDETLETLEAIRDALTAVRSAKAAAVAVAEATAERRAALAAEIGGEEASEAAPEGEPEVAAEGETLAAETEAAEVEAEPVEAPAPKKAPPSLSALRQFAPEDTTPESAPVTAPKRLNVTASLDVPGFTVGAEYANVRQIAEAMIARRTALGNTRGDNVSGEKVAIAHIDYLDDLLQVTDDKMLNGLLLMQAAQPEALTASGGFIAPAAVVYDFVKVNQPTDLVQDFLPVVGAPRGSIEYPTSPDIRDAFTANVARAYSQADDIASVNKVTAVIAAPAFNTCVVGAEYVILQFGNLGSRAYPEWVEHWIGLSMDAHAHKVSQKLIAQMVAGSDAGIGLVTTGSVTAQTLHNVVLAAADLRHDLRMPKTAQVEVVLPSWFHSLVQSDLALTMKGDLAETMGVTDATIDGWFTSKNITLRYVEDWQDIDGSATTGASVWPANIQFMLYPPGTWVKLDMGTLDLGVVRDSTLNKTNDYNIFVETFEAACKVGIASRLYAMPICANGAFSRGIALNCVGANEADS